MFTGIIEGVGRAAARQSIGGDVRFTFNVGSLPFEHVQMGESIAVNGVCLTVIAFDATSFQADASTETLSLTTLGELGEGAPVNLERACARPTASAAIWSAVMSMASAACWRSARMRAPSAGASPPRQRC
jgi:Riboflavin synthase alpha chain